MEEIWKPIHGCDDYLISSEGRIKDLKKNRFISLNGTKTPYILTTLRSNTGGSFDSSLHRLLAKAFIPNPDNKQYVNHIDGNKRNNTLSNLEWCTPSENIQHSYRTGLNKGLGGPKKENVLIRATVLLDDDIIELLTKEAKEKSISVSAVIRQKVEAMIKFKQEIEAVINKTGRS